MKHFTAEYQPTPGTVGDPISYTFPSEDWPAATTVAVAFLDGFDEAKQACTYKLTKLFIEQS